jgi:hypothetical protein
MWKSPVARGIIVSHGDPEVGCNNHWNGYVVHNILFQCARWSILHFAQPPCLISVFAEGIG